MRLAIVTGFNSDYQEMGNLCFRSILRHASKHGHAAAAELIPADFGREAPWAKIGIIRKHLKCYHCVLWMDADSMLVGETDIGKVLQEHTLNISKDHNGINCGVMAWCSNLESFKALKRMEDDYTHNRWFEQPALAKFVDKLDVCYHEKTVLNAYRDSWDAPNDVSDATMIMHWPGMRIERRLELMQNAWRDMEK